MDLINVAENQFDTKKEFPSFSAGDTITVEYKIIEGNKERVQFYEGIILAKKNSSINTTITVRKILQGIGTERIFLVHSPKIDSIAVFYRLGLWENDVQVINKELVQQLSLLSEITRKKNIPEGILVENHGFQDDAHAGDWQGD